MAKEKASSKQIKMLQNKRALMVGGVVAALSAILLLTFIRPKQETDLDTLSRKSEVFDVTKKIDDQSVWKYQSERQLNQALSEIKKLNDTHSNQFEQRIKELEAKLDEKAKLLDEIVSQDELLEDDSPQPSSIDEQDLIKNLIKVSDEHSQDAPQNNSSHQQWQRPASTHHKQYLPDGYQNQSFVSSAIDVSQPSAVRAPSAGIFSINLALKEQPMGSESQFPTVKEVIPAGSFARGILLNGVDVSTGDFAKKHPASLVIRLVHQGSLPNEVVGDMKDCRLTASAFGHRSNERAEIRLEKLSCVQQDLRVITTDVRGYVVGSDGKQGVRGKMIRRGQELFWQGMIGQGLSSMSKAVSSAAGTSSVSPQGIVKSFDTNEAIKGAGYAGAGGALDRFAEQAIKELDEIKPVIQISASLPVDVVFLESTPFGEKRSKMRSQGSNMLDGVDDILGGKS